MTAELVQSVKLFLAPMTLSCGEALSGMPLPLGRRLSDKTACHLPAAPTQTINYLGRNSLRPASERLLDLRDGERAGSMQCIILVVGRPHFNLY